MAAVRSSFPTLEIEQALYERGHRCIAGVDEVGRGSWAGPLVAAAVILPTERPGVAEELSGVRDSKLLSCKQRHTLLRSIMSTSIAIGIGWSTHHVIDRMGIAAANRRAMERAVSHLQIVPDVLLVDYVNLPEIEISQVHFPKLDSLSLSVAAASVVAKVVRDRWMRLCDQRFPGYGFALHKGYGTPFHRRTLDALGPSPLHRRSFRPVSTWTE